MVTESEVVDPGELAPTETGDLRLEEIESGTAFDVTANETLLQRYRAEVARYNGELEAFCRQRAIAHAQVRCDVPFQDVVLRVLRDGLMLR